MKIIIAGLGRMGGQIARKLAESEHEVVAHNRSPGPIDEAVSRGAKGAYTKSQAIGAFANEPVILWLMLPESIIDSELDKWLKIIPRNSIVIDGGNSDFRTTRARAPKIKSRKMYLVDVGTSGGVWGYKNGFSMMVGGDEKAFKTVEPALEILAKPRGGYQYFGDSGAGHFVKMVHNAIEYGMMEALAEGYRLLAEGPYKNLDLAAAADVWQRRSVITSWLNELCLEVFKANPNLRGIDGVVEESGEARWALEVAREMKIPMPAIQTSFDIRLRSQKGDVNFSTKALAAMRNKFGGHQINPDS